MLTWPRGRLRAERGGKLAPPTRKGVRWQSALGHDGGHHRWVPGGAILGTVLSWRATFWAIALLCLPAAFGVMKGIPARVGKTSRDSPAGSSLRNEIAQLAMPRLVLVMLLGALVNAATFATFTFLAPIVTDTAGLGELWVSVVLVLFGVGSFLGVTLAGRLSDQRPGLVIAVGGPLLLLGWFALATLAAQPVALLLLVFVQGTLSFALGSTLIARVLYEASRSPHHGRFVCDRGAQHRCRWRPCRCRSDARGQRERPWPGVGQRPPGHGRTAHRPAAAAVHRTPRRPGDSMTHANASTGGV